MRRGHVAEAWAHARAAEAGVRQQQDPDDRAATYARLATIHRHGGRDAVAAALQQRADEALAEHQASQAATRRALDQTLANLTV